MHHIGSRVANGNVTPMHLVKYDTTVTTGRVIECSATTDFPMGIAQQGSRRIPGSSLGLDDGYCAISGEEFKVFLPGSTDVPVVLGGTAVAGDLVGPNTDGTAIVVTADHKTYIGRIKNGGASGDIAIIDTLMFGEISQ